MQKKICERECFMKWVEIEIITTEEASEAICEMLSQLGADGIAVCDPLEIKRIIDDHDRKILMLCEDEIEDPWYTDHFDLVYDQILEGIRSL